MPKNNKTYGMSFSFNIRSIVVLFSLLLSQVSCKKFIQVEAPPIKLSNENIFVQDNTAIAALTGVYIRMGQFGFAGSTSISFYTALSADELQNLVPNPDRDAYYKNTLVSNNAINIGSEYWLKAYELIYTTNSVISGLSNSNSLTSSVKQQLLGEAKFLRAFLYFYLVNLYGDVPIVLKSDWVANSRLNRSPTAQVYEQILKDLKESADVLSGSFVNETLAPYANNPERVRPTKAAAKAMMARVYLFIGDYINAELMASEVIADTKFSLLSLNMVFLKNSSEAIWQLQPVNLNRNTEDGFIFILPNTGPDDSHPVALSSMLLDSFEVGDGRKVNWTNNVILGNNVLFYPFKYKVSTGSTLTEYQTVLRLAEQYLIRAEARAQLNKLPQAISDLDKIRERAGLSLISVTNPTITKENLLKLILHERQVELFTEWGHRWLDLKRTGNIDAVMSIVTPLKSSQGENWNSYQRLYPIPFSDISTNPAITQNVGY